MKQLAMQIKIETDPLSLCCQLWLLDKVNFIKIGHYPSTHKLRLICLLNSAEQASWKPLVRPRGSSDQKIEMGFTMRVKKLSLSENFQLFL